MTENSDKEETRQLPVLSAQGEALVTQIIDDVFRIDLKEAVHVVEDKLKRLSRQEVGEAFDCLQVALQSLWRFFEALMLVRGQADWAKAHELLLSAAKGFDSIGRAELRDLSIGMGTYSEAIIELQKFNISQALDLIANVTKYLDSAGEFGSKFKPLIDHMGPDALFIAGVKALLELDFSNGKTLIEKASQSAEKVASDYYEEGSPMYNTFQGYARYYKAYYTYLRAGTDFNQFQFDGLIAQKDLVEDALQAKQLLSKGDLQNELTRAAAQISNALLDLLRAYSDLAQLMNNIFHSTFKPGPSALLHIKKRIAAASDSAAKAGTQAAPLVRACAQLSDGVNNLERLAKPSKKDFGAFSGLVASALFLPLFLVVSWSNATFSIGLNAKTLISSCLILALIGGFGFGALRFKSLIFPARTGEE
jgi:hypothetical protein